MVVPLGSMPLTRLVLGSAFGRAWRNAYRLARDHVIYGFALSVVSFLLVVAASRGQITWPAFAALGSFPAVFSLSFVVSLLLSPWWDSKWKPEAHVDADGSLLFELESRRPEGRRYRLCCKVRHPNGEVREHEELASEALNLWVRYPQHFGRDEAPPVVPGEYQIAWLSFENGTWKLLQFQRFYYDGETVTPVRLTPQAVLLRALGRGPAPVAPTSRGQREV